MTDEGPVRLAQVDGTDIVRFDRLARTLSTDRPRRATVGLSFVAAADGTNPTTRSNDGASKFGPDWQRRPR